MFSKINVFLSLENKILCISQYKGQFLPTVMKQQHVIYLKGTDGFERAKEEGHLITFHKGME